MKEKKRSCGADNPLHIIPDQISSGFDYSLLFVDFRSLIESSKVRVASGINREMVLLYWSVGCRIGQDILAGERAEYGMEIVAALSRQLSGDYGRGFNRTNLFHMIRFAEVFSRRDDCLLAE
jgi:hypothetical protein